MVQANFRYILIILILFTLSACEASNIAPTPTTNVSTPSIQPIPDVTPVQLTTAAPVQSTTLSKLRSLSFGQGNDSGGHVFKDLKAEELPAEPFQIVYHLEDVNI